MALNVRTNVHAAAVAALGFGPGAFAIARGLGAPNAAALIVAAVAIATLALVTRRRPSPAEPWPAPLAIAGSLLLLAGGVAIVRQTAFMVDPSLQALSAAPASMFMVKHHCWSAYSEASRLLAEGHANVYEGGLYDGEGGGMRFMAGAFMVDPYHYPPPFLLLPDAVRAITSDYLHQRMLWFGVALSSLTAAIVGAALHAGGRAGRIMLALAPIVFIALSGRLALQVGNFQAVAIAWSMLAMLAFARGRTLAGGALLGFAMVGKIYPGLLLVYLLGARKYREAAATIAGAVGFVAVFAIVHGTGTLRAFVGYELPLLSTGEAFGALNGLPWAVTINHSFSGIVYKLHLLGASWATFEVAAKVAWVYTLVVVAVAFMSGRARRTSAIDVLVWICILGLAAMRSPFLPQGYGLLAPLWATTMLAMMFERRPLLGAAVVAIAWSALQILPPLELYRVRGPQLSVALGAVSQAASLAIITGSLLFARRRRFSV